MRKALRIAVVLFALVGSIGLVLMLSATPDNVRIGEMPKQFGLGVWMTSMAVGGMALAGAGIGLLEIAARTRNRRSVD